MLLVGVAVEGRCDVGLAEFVWEVLSSLRVLLDYVITSSGIVGNRKTRTPTAILSHLFIWNNLVYTPLTNWYSRLMLLYIFAKVSSLYHGVENFIKQDFSSATCGRSANFGCAGFSVARESLSFCRSHFGVTTCYNKHYQLIL